MKKIFFPRAYQYEGRSYDNDLKRLRIPRTSDISLDAIHFEHNSDILVILNHPYRTEAKDYYLDSGHIEIYKSLDCDVLIYDFNGFGQSDDVDMKLWKDTQAVAQYVKKNMDYGKVILHGISLGASQAINACDMDLGIDTLIIESCLDKNASYFLKRNKKIYVLLTALTIVVPFLLPKTSFLREIKRLRSLKKVIFVYGEDDDLTTIDMGKQLYERCPMASEFHILKGGHLELHTKDPSRYIEVLKEVVR